MSPEMILKRVILDMDLCVECRSCGSACFYGHKNQPIINYADGEKAKVPVIGCGGVATAADAAEMMLAGAAAVQVGTALFANLHVSADICAGLKRYLAEQNEKNISAIVGTLKLN